MLVHINNVSHWSLSEEGLATSEIIAFADQAVILPHLSILAELPLLSAEHPGVAVSHLLEVLAVTRAFELFVEFWDLLDPSVLFGSYFFSNGVGNQVTFYLFYLISGVNFDLKLLREAWLADWFPYSS
jgi:hypothetical protein